MAQPLSRQVRCEALRCAPLFTALPQSDLETLASFVTERRLAADETLVRRGDLGRSMMVLVEGQLRIAVVTADGREVVLGMIGPGSVVGEMAVLDNGPRSADVTAMEPSLVLVLTQDRLLPFLQTRPDLLLRLLQILCTRLRRTDQALEDLVSAPVSVRLGRLLLLLAAEHGVTDASGTHIRRRLSQRELGTQIGATREVVNRQLSQWRKDGILGEQDGYLLVQQAGRLRAIVEA
jgi:CRP/FNR family transcriptional regulator, cyclic AMP receptor protein